MKTEKYTVIAPVMHQGVVVESGDIELTTDQADRLITLEVIKVNEEAKVKAEVDEEAVKIAEATKKEAEKLLKTLRKKATELGIQGVDEMDAETLAAEIEVAQQK